MLSSIRKTTPWIGILGLLVFLALPALAGGPPTLVGSWQGSSTVTGSTESSPLLATFGSDGTFVSTGPSNSGSIAHGAWQRSGPRQYRTTTVFFLYDGAGNAFATGRTNTVVEVSLGGQTLAGTLSGEVRLLDGTPIDSFTATLEASRINVETP